MKVDCATPISTGAGLATRHGLIRDIGVTINISKVPAPLTRPTTQEIINVCKKLAEAISAGMIFQRDSKLGLYQARLHLNRHH